MTKRIAALVGAAVITAAALAGCGGQGGAPSIIDETDQNDGWTKVTDDLYTMCYLGSRVYENHTGDGLYVVSNDPTCTDQPGATTP